MDNAVRPAIWTDQKWVARLFDQNKEILGNIGGGLVFYRWFNGGRAHEKWIVIPEVGFAHYLIRQRDGVRVLYEIAVSKEHRRQGIGKKLLAEIGRPIELKTDAENEASNAFYRGLGFMCVGQKRGGSGKLANVYQAW